MIRQFLALCACLWMALPAVADDGYRLWLRYDRIGDDALRAGLAARLAEVVFDCPASADTVVLAAARAELVRGLEGMLAQAPTVRQVTTGGGLPAPEGYVITQDGGRVTIAAGDAAGILYGTFALLRAVQVGTPPDALTTASAPRIQRRLLNHWDNLDRTVERGTAGFSLWDWFQLPDHVDPRYTDYARACASIGINGTVLTNVNANALVLTPDYMDKVAAIATAMRPFNVRVYLTARFSAPMEIGDLPTADPLDPRVAAWWQAKVDEIYTAVPDFGGFLVKANSEGQPGPQDYGRSHADGANMLARALAPHGGIVMWRAFVYSHEVPDDRAKQAYSEFQPLDGEFLPNVVIQIKNGPIDFMPREPFHPLFGAMPRTNLGLELQITKEYLGFSLQLAYLGPLFEEVLDADTHAQGAGSTVARVIDGSLDDRPISVIAGVANTGTDRNWTGHPLAQADWYAYGRLAWDHTLPARDIAQEWVRMTFPGSPAAHPPLTDMLMESREAVVDYSMPLGLHHIMAEGHHYGPGPWVADAGRPDWTSVYYHRADKEGVGFDRTATGSDALAQYAPAVARQWGSLDTVPDSLLLWFHHVPWGYRMRSGRTLWDELALHYQSGVDTVRQWQATWDSLRGSIDPQTWAHVHALLAHQERDARMWRDACLLYFQTFSGLPLPEGVEPPAHDLEHYKSIRQRYFPGNPGG